MNNQNALDAHVALVEKAQSLLASYLPPDDIGEDQLINGLIGLFDGPEQRAARDLLASPLLPQQGGQIPCRICGENEPRTGTCGSDDPTALCKASPLPQQGGETTDMPELPEPFHMLANSSGWPDLFTSAQMRDYGLKCRLATLAAVSLQVGEQTDRLPSEIMAALRKEDDESKLAFSAKEMRTVMNLWRSELDMRTTLQDRLDKLYEPAVLPQVGEAKLDRMTPELNAMLTLLGEIVKNEGYQGRAANADMLASDIRGLHLQATAAAPVAQALPVAADRNTILEEVKDMLHKAGRDFSVALVEKMQSAAMVCIGWDYCRDAVIEAQGVPVAAEKDAQDVEIERLNKIINTPQSGDFLRAVSIEAEHQRQRWGSNHDAGKTPADWFWLVGYLAGKALHSHIAGNMEKTEHHIITTAAACLNWHMAMFGRTDMRPGIDGAAAMQGEKA